MRRLHRGLPSVLAFAFALAACAPAPPDDDPGQRYAAWQRSAATGVAQYRQRLAAEGVADIVPMPALLRSSRRWRACDAPEFLLPPASRMAAIAPTLELVAELQARGLLRAQDARSGYRDAALNRCSGGSPRSRHLENRALDFDLSADTAGVEALCRFWRREGARRQMGLGFYTPTRIHVDTAGHRTWGSDHRRGTSLCVAPPQSGRNASRTQTP